MNKMNKKEINEIMEKNIKDIERMGGEITHIEKRETYGKIHFKDHFCDCYGGFYKVRTVKFQKEERKTPTPKPKPQSGELCPHCGNRIERKHKFCPQCGQKITKEEKPQNGIKFCPHCGQKIGENNKFCPHCGQKITNGGE